MVESPLVSVIVPIYNGEPFLDLCLQTIFDQTYKNLEIWLVDDGSTDGSPAMCDAFAARDPRVRVIHQPNRGQSAARNVALDRMNGEYVTFIDCDDFVRPDMVEHLLAIAKEYDADNVSADAYATSERTLSEVEERPLQVTVVDPVKVIEDPEIFELYGATVLHKLYEKSLFSDLRFTEGMIYEDAAIRVPLMWRTRRLAISNQIVYYYYYSPNSTMRSAFSEKRLDQMKVRELHLAFFKEHGRMDLYQKTVMEYYFDIAKLWFNMVLSDWPERFKYLPVLREKEKELRPELKGNPYYPLSARVKRFAFRYFPRLLSWYFNRGKT